MVMVSVEAWLTLTSLGANDFEMVGGVSTVRVALAAAVLLAPSIVLSAPAGIELA